MAQREAPPSRDTGDRWRGRPMLAALLHGVLLAVPVVVATVVVRAGAGQAQALPWYVRLGLGTVVAILVAIVVERWLRRFLPLAALLRMTMLFPDRAPSRLAVARRIGHPRQLAATAAAHPHETLGEAAERILVLISTLGAHDRRTRGHSERVRVFTDLVSDQLGLDRDARDRLRWAALLHDLGKVEVPAAVLNKPARLDAAEWELIRAHPRRGVELAGPLTSWLGPWAAAIGEHHERHDGGGYPLGLRGHDIALAGRIVAVADTFEVMTAARSYKRPMSVRAARVELARVAGSQLDPLCVRALLSASLPRLLWAVGPLSLLVNLPFLRSLADAGRALDGTVSGIGGQAATTAAAALTGVAVVAAPAASAVPPAPVRPGTVAVAPSQSAGGDPSPQSLPSPVAAPTGPGATRVTTEPRPPQSGGPTPLAPTTAPATLQPGPMRNPGSGAPGSGPTPGPGATTPPVTAPTPPPVVATPSTPSASPTPTATAGRDRTAPVVTITSAPLLNLLSSTATVAFTSDDPTATFTCRLDGNPWRACTSPVTYTGLKLGGHRIEVRATDPAGNESDKARADFDVIALGIGGL